MCYFRHLEQATMRWSSQLMWICQEKCHIEVTPFLCANMGIRGKEKQ